MVPTAAEGVLEAGATVFDVDVDVSIADDEGWSVKVVQADIELAAPSAAILCPLYAPFMQEQLFVPEVPVSGGIAMVGWAVIRTHLTHDRSLPWSVPLVTLVVR